MSRIIFSIIFLFKYIMPGHAELCFFNFCVGKRQETFLEKIFRYLNEFVVFVGKEVYVFNTMLFLSTVGIVTIIGLLFKLLKGMHRTQTNEPSKSKNQCDLDFANHNQTPKSSTFLLSSFEPKTLSKSSTNILNNTEPESTSLSQQKRASCSTFCNYPPL